MVGSEDGVVVRGVIVVGVVIVMIVAVAILQSLVCLEQRPCHSWG